MRIRLIYKQLYIYRTLAIAFYKDEQLTIIARNGLFNYDNNKSLWGWGMILSDF